MGGGQHPRPTLGKMGGPASLGWAPPLCQGENFEKLWEVQFLGFTGIFSKMLVFKTCANVPCYLGGPHSV